MSLPAATRFNLFVQREVGRLLSVVWIPASAFILSVIMRYRVRDVRELRRRFRLRPLRWGDAELIAATGPPFEVIQSEHNFVTKNRLRRRCENRMPKFI